MLASLNPSVFSKWPTDSLVPGRASLRPRGPKWLRERLRGEDLALGTKQPHQRPCHFGGGEKNVAQKEEGRKGGRREGREGGGKGGRKLSRSNEIVSQVLNARPSWGDPLQNTWAQELNESLLSRQVYLSFIAKPKRTSKYPQFLITYTFLFRPPN